MSLNHGVKEFSNKRLGQVTDDVLQSQVLTGIFEHSLKLFLAHVLVVPNLIQVRGYANICGKEQDVVDWVGMISMAHIGEVYYRRTFVFTPDTV